MFLTFAHCLNWCFTSGNRDPIVYDALVQQCITWRSSSPRSFAPIFRGDNDRMDQNPWQEERYLNGAIGEALTLAS